eukprot:Seg3053.4 transcript_id=Seg3053.4/GoldUCD/mRNA.D3Y31 product="hypothetical protein" protein_id=Seg3053.4/GoldUCD/D3Y31
MRFSKRTQHLITLHINMNNCSSNNKQPQQKQLRHQAQQQLQQEPQLRLQQQQQQQLDQQPEQQLPQQPQQQLQQQHEQQLPQQPQQQLHQQPEQQLPQQPQQQLHQQPQQHFQQQHIRQQQQQQQQQPRSFYQQQQDVIVPPLRPTIPSSQPTAAPQPNTPNQHQMVFSLKWVAGTTVAKCYGCGKKIQNPPICTPDDMILVTRDVRHYRDPVTGQMTVTAQPQNVHFHLRFACVVAKYPLFVQTFLVVQPEFVPYLNVDHIQRLASEFGLAINRA